ncbi:hydroxyacylglutathione hydrolase [Agaricicola taiwanensis]|uniref:Hydroxyacylglutathione hydrolase n=1 Tax=Agaricicola taiwanensis TaxID=591372 RepID=A0A8J3DX66_9RHOB|nr:hydroxyacylglutathione hydrolase [Agaricicola taiwanensis]GGE51008.1 hydroxyacylglutathione hydrolase [Agaricicola taiwanensis]
MSVDVRLIPCRNDNYAVLVHDPEDGTTLLVDAPEAAPIQAVLDETGWKLSDILITHHHIDHVEGIAPLKSAYGATVTGPEKEKDKIPGIDKTVRDGDTLTFGRLTAKVIETPGHTKGHVSYHFADQKLLFAADTLFALGCGRLLEDTPEAMWTSLKKLRELPDDTEVYCGHEYTLSNARFALTVDPDNGELKTRSNAIELLVQEGSPTVPSLLGIEKATNPFLRADDPAVAAGVGMPGADPLAVFTEVRARKDRF